MLPTSLRSTYQQYKQDTNIVASWLASTALQTGYSAPLNQVNGSSVASSSQRLKGKARKEAKKKQAAASTAPTDAKPKHIIAIKDFVPLAEHISGTLSSTLPVPDFFSAALDRVIESRKRFSSLLGKFQAFRNVIGDRQHAYFVTVLEKVRDAFKSHVGPFDTGALRNALPTVEVKSNDKNKSTAEARNMFESLRVYEPSESFLSAPDVASTTHVDVEYIAEEDPKTESLFVFSSLLADLFQLREEITDLWNEYRAGTKDLAAVSVATNTAFQLARSMEEEVSTLLDRIGGVMELIPMTYSSACASRNLDYDEIQRPTDDFNYDCYPEGNQFFYNALNLLNAYKNVSISEEQPFYSGKFGWYDRRRTARNHRQQWEEDKAALLEVFSDLTFIFASLKGVEIQDEFTRGLKQMMTTKKVPGIWLCFATQSYLDILKLLGPDVDRVVNMWASDNDIFSLTRQAFKITRREPVFLAHNPMFCGLHTHDVRVLFHRFGIEYASKPGNVMHTVQLYQALRQENILGEDEKRDDLEFMMKMQGDSTFFVGNPPRSPEAYSKNFGLTKGISATHWIPGPGRKKKGSIPRSQAGVRIMKFKALVSMAFGSTMLVSSDSRGLNAEAIDQILERSGWFKKHGTSGQPGGGNESSGQGNADSPEKSRKVPRALGPVELVHQVCLAIDDEVSDIMFDYFKIEDTCKGILKRVLTSPVPDTLYVRSIEGPPSIEADGFKPNWDAIETEYKAAFAKAVNDPTLTRRLNTGSANNVGYGQAIYAAGSAAISQVKSLSDWNKAREQFTQLTTQIMMDHNPNSTEAVSAICYNKAYDVQDAKGIYGLRSEELSVFPAKTDYDCFYMGKNNAFWSQGDGGTINLYTRWYSNSGCRFDDQSDLYC
ncbi:hypothetical protein CkaCkLH20_08732 [Colletotrichum karsti]|uniref:Uncharacterized protein n=1 Tax=Colletotrichum karsti TaxID=1095194 RepID=A0A9P6I0N1_9PEZI|nr:uncharacterized protein CkaCkLH20_08732 [Colletotrichum karsti]KAF9873622.1 hypothetical protein CkaCkLH20_08732 [Colletotrichum karsti]